MAVNNPFSITYGALTVGGTSDSYQLNGPYSLTKDYRSLLVVFEVVVVATSLSNLYSLSDALEVEFAKRDQNLTISIDGSDWLYESGVTALNVVSTVSKTGNREIDGPLARSYTVSVSAELPEEAGGGLLESAINVSYDTTRRRTVTFRGTYTANDSGSATANYLANADGVASTFLSALGGTYELVLEEYTERRDDNLCDFSRQYQELLFNQSSGTLDDSSIKDHRVIFTDTSQHPGDSREDVSRLRRVIGQYDCSVDVEVTTNLQQIVDGTVRDYILQQFQGEFSPTVFGVEDYRVSYDETSKRLSVSMQFLYQTSSGSDVVEVSITRAFRESRAIDYTPVHNGDELAAYVDAGFLIRERITQRTAVVIGETEPKRRIGIRDDPGPEGDLGIEAPRGLARSGWNIIDNASSVTDQWIGDPALGERLKLAVISEQVTERFNVQPARSGGTVGQPGPTTPGGGAEPGRPITQ